jgi:hypothetical protein
MVNVNREMKGEGGEKQIVEKKRAIRKVRMAGSEGVRCRRALLDEHGIPE